MLLEVEDLCVNYGRIEAIRNISFTVEEGEIVTLIGANGAGKTTTMKTVSGLRPVRQGTIRFKGEDITAMPAHERPVLGIGQSPEGRGCFVGMTVLENLDMGTYARKDRKSPKVKEDRDRVFGLFPRLAERRSQVAGTMSGGEQQMLAMSRALVTDPGVLLLDEISMGLAPKIVSELYELVGQLAQEGISILLVEQFARTALAVSDYAAVMTGGRIAMVGQPADVADFVNEAYLGGAA